MYIIIVVLGLLLLLASLVVGTILGYKKYIKHEILSTVVLLITVPRELARRDDTVIEPENAKDFKEAIAPGEQLIASFHSLLEKGFMADLIERQPTIGLEIVYHHGQISFYVTTSRKYVQLVTQQIQSYLPHAEIEEVPGYKLFEGENKHVSSAELEHEKRYIYPIRTYRYLDADPLNNLTNVLATLGHTNSAAIQILIKPLSDKWRIYAVQAATDVLHGKVTYSYNTVWQRVLAAFSGWIQGGINKTSQSASVSHEDGQIKMRHTPAQEELMKAFNEKASKTGFLTMIRVISVSDTAQIANSNLNNILAGFSQFNAPAWNGFQVDNKISGPHQMSINFLLKTFGSKRGILLNSEEIASIWHLPNQYTETPSIRWLLSRTLAAPVNLPTEGITLGKSVYRNQIKDVKIKTDDRRRHIFMIGKTGVGKTTLFENAIDQDIASGAGVCYLDPNGDAIESILQKIPKERAEDVILFDPADVERPFGLNMLEWKYPQEKDFLVAEWIEIFYKLFDPNRTGMVGPQFEHWGRNASLTVMSIPGGGTLIDIPRLFTDDAFRDYAVSYVTDPVVKAFWEQQLAKTADFHKSEMFNYFISKFGRFMTNDLMRNVIGQTKSSFDIREIMDSKKILLVNLAKGKIGETNSYLLGMVLVSKIQTAAFSRADTPEHERPDFYLYVDEFQNFTTDTFATILSEARKFRLNLAITNQYIAQLTEKIRDAVIGNAGTLISYRIGASDAEFMAKEFPGVSIDDLVNLEKYTTYVKLLIDGSPTKPFTMKGILSQVAKDKERGEAIRQLSRLKHGQDKAKVDAMFASRMKAGELSNPNSKKPMPEI